jgi:hypothetical protein
MKLNNQELFKTTILDSQNDTLLFNSLKELLENKKNLNFKKIQIQIEKLMNVYLLKKKEKIYYLNPF